MEDNSIIKDYEKLQDWELELLVKRNYEWAILEQARRWGQILLYPMPMSDGEWAASAEGCISDGFTSKEAARTWVYQKLEEAGWGTLKRRLTCYKWTDNHRKEGQ